MCEYCGCRGVEPIAELMDEHHVMLELGGDIRRALDVGDTQRADDLLVRLAELLLPHVDVEERGVFAALREEGEFVDHVDELAREHVHLDRLLVGLAAASPAAVVTFLDALDEHIAKEDLGLFPVAVVSLGAAGWDRVTAAHETRAAVPGVA